MLEKHGDGSQSAIESLRTSQKEKPFLLVIVGALGDWCVRRVLSQATEFLDNIRGAERVRPKSGQVEQPNGVDAEAQGTALLDDEIVAIDVHPFEDIERYIVGRLIEQSAAELHQPIQEPDADFKKSIQRPTRALRQLAGINFPDPSRKTSGSGAFTYECDEAISRFLEEHTTPAFRKYYKKDPNADRDAASGEVEIGAFVRAYKNEIEATINSAGSADAICEVIENATSRYDPSVGKGLINHVTNQRKNWNNLSRSFVDTIKDDIANTMLDYLLKQLRARADKLRGRLQGEESLRARLVNWLQEPVNVFAATGDPDEGSLDDLHIEDDLHIDQYARYWRYDSRRRALTLHPSDEFGDEFGGQVYQGRDLTKFLRGIACHRRIVVYVGTPPSVYPDVLDMWAPYAQRIALEKPVADLLETPADQATQPEQDASRVDGGQKSREVSDRGGEE